MPKSELAKRGIITSRGGGQGVVELDPSDLRKALECLGVQYGSGEPLPETLPFSAHDTTAGSETELQAAVVGDRQDVDLPLAIEGSNYYANLRKRIAAQDMPQQAIQGLDEYLMGNAEDTWENSWVRFPRRVLSAFANRIFAADLYVDKKDPGLGRRSDLHQFIAYEGGEEWLRLPVSYLLKLSLADCLGTIKGLPLPLRQMGVGLMSHFLNDNTSPETFTFFPVPLLPQNGHGRAIAKETAKRFLLTQLLMAYANRRFLLRENGQQALIYFSPHPPIRQKWLNDCIPDAFYRELFMSPCLSGWDRGEAKKDYMHLCHQVLSRSQWNAVAKLREAGIINGSRVIAPNLSNISLANNGTHLSLGSLRLTRALRDKASGFTPVQEKYLGDLVIKIMEHFLPLFVGTYSAAPYRLDFSDFHPEKVLGFLPHELDYTHLRMIWRRWKKKAGLKILGHPITPTGWRGLDHAITLLFRLRGDCISDFRLIDYLVCLMSTDQSPALDGRLGNDERLKKDLADLGVFDRKMSLYLLCRLREFTKMGFSGFEGRHYSLFESLEGDMGRAADVQTLVTALAFKYLARGEITHAHIPDDPSLESERRQIFFGSAMGIPTFYVRQNTRNLFLQRIVERTKRTRPSHRYPGYIRVYHLEYRRTLARILREEAADLIEILGLEETLRDLSIRLDDPAYGSVTERLLRGILQEANVTSPFQLSAREFNGAAERYYRGTLREKHLGEAFRLLEEDLRTLAESEGLGGSPECTMLRAILRGRSSPGFLSSIKAEVLEERASLEDLQKLIQLTLVSVYHDRKEAEIALDQTGIYETGPTPIYRAAYG